MEAYKKPSGFHIQMFFPVEGESAIAELYFDDENWADIELENIQLQAVGDARLTGARVSIRFYPPNENKAAQVGLDYLEVRKQLDQAYDYLIENERRRLPE